MSKTLAKCMEKLEKLKDDEKRSVQNLGKSSLTSTPVEMNFFRLKRISFDQDYPHEQALENVFPLYKNEAARMIYYIRSDGREISCYMGVASSKSQGRGNFLANMLSGALRGNFRGTLLSEESTQSVQSPILNPRLHFSVALGVPSRSSRQTEIEFQSVDHVIHSMHGQPFHILIVWKALSREQIEDMEETLFTIYSELYSFASGNKSTGKQDSENVNDGKESHSSSSSSSENWCSRSLQSLLKSLDDEHLPRMRLGKARGMFHTTTYLGAESEESLSLLESSFTSVFQSNPPSSAPLYVRRLPQNPNIAQAIANAEIFSDLSSGTDWLELHSRLLTDGYKSLATCLTAKELSIIAGFPHADVPGIEVRQRVSFGLNIPTSQQNQKTIKLGKLLQDGEELPIEVSLPVSDLERHIFIAGTTGAGKTNTCHRLLQEFGKRFMVIEPAKTEYRSLLLDSSMHDLLIFTIGNENGVPFRMNPFEFLPSESISAHIDMLKACFMASFNMEAAIPNLLEEGMYRLYERFGWDIGNNNNRFLGSNQEKAWSEKHRGRWFPTISDYVRVVNEVIANKGFDERLKNDYIGSIRARLESMTVGIKGLMLNTRRSIDFNWLIDQKVVIELEEMKSGEDKAFIMALIVGRLLETLKERYRKNQESQDSKESFQHALLIEEAHRLLSMPNIGDSAERRLGVEMLTDMLAEVRKYHEGIVIVDQIPSKLASDVLKNTNTKIIHRLFAEEDKRAIGDAIALSEKQREFLSHLDIGEAIISGNGWSKAVHTRIDLVSDRENTVSDERAFDNGEMFWKEHKSVFCPSFVDNKDQNPNRRKLRYMCEIARDIRALLASNGKNKYENWNALFTKWESRVGNDYEHNFLRTALHDEIFVDQLFLSGDADFDMQKRQNIIKSVTRYLLDRDKDSFKEFQSIYCGN